MNSSQILIFLCNYLTDWLRHYQKPCLLEYLIMKDNNSISILIFHMKKERSKMKHVFVWLKKYLFKNMIWLHIYFIFMNLDWLAKTKYTFDEKNSGIYTTKNLYELYDLQHVNLFYQYHNFSCYGTSDFASDSDSCSKSSGSGNRCAAKRKPNHSNTFSSNSYNDNNMINFNLQIEFKLLKISMFIEDR